MTKIEKWRFNARVSPEELCFKMRSKTSERIAKKRKAIKKQRNLDIQLIDVNKWKVTRLMIMRESSRQMTNTT